MLQSLMAPVAQSASWCCLAWRTRHTTVSDVRHEAAYHVDALFFVPHELEHPLRA